MLNYSFSMGIAVSSLLICIVNLIYTFIQGRTDKAQNKFFIIIVCILATNSITGIVSAIVTSGYLPLEQSIPLHKISRSVYFATHTALCPMFYYYVSKVSFVSTRIRNTRTLLKSLPFIVTEILALTGSKS